MAYIIKDNETILIHNGEVIKVTSKKKYYKKFKKLVSQGKENDAYNLFKKRSALSVPKPFSIVNRQLMLDDYYVPEAVSKRVIGLMEEGLSVDYILTFLINLDSNPSKRAVDELLGFLECNDLPITKDGCFMAYKSIRDDFKDMYSGTFDNRVGSRVSMPRNKVDDDKNRTCSQGLHVASLNYLKHYRGARLVAVKINPKDVVSVPVDYDNSKMRVSSYEVMEELDTSIISSNEEFFESNLY